MANLKEKVGIVCKNAMDKTVVVLVERHKIHPVFKKEVRVHKKFYAHDEENAARVGDLVRIVETRPLSKMKRWRVAEILQKKYRV